MKILKEILQNGKESVEESNDALLTLLKKNKEENKKEDKAKKENKKWVLKNMPKIKPKN